MFPLLLILVKGAGCQWIGIASNGALFRGGPFRGSSGYPSRMVKHIVWDWNGTLLNDVDAVVAATNSAFRRLAFEVEEVGRDQWRASYCRPIQAFYQRLLGWAPTSEQFVELDTVFHDEYRLLLPDCALAADALPTLTGWQRSGRTQSLLSMWRHHELVPYIDHSGLTTYFTRVDGLTGAAGGPKAEHLAKHLAALGLDPAEVGLVGDSHDDALAAQHVGAACVLYSGGFHDPASLTGLGWPVAHSLSEAVELLTTGAVHAD